MKTASQIVELFNSNKVEVDYTSMTKNELIAVIKDLESKVSSNRTVNDLVIELLKDERFLDASNIVIAEAVRLLIPSSETTSKSVSSIRSVYNKQILDKAALELSNLEGRELMLAKAGLEFDLLRSGELIPQRQ